VAKAAPADAGSAPRGNTRLSENHLGATRRTALRKARKAIRDAKPDALAGAWTKYENLKMRLGDELDSEFLHEVEKDLPQPP
jgi:kynureninase